jgi:hypothetical protein
LHGKKNGDCFSIVLTSCEVVARTFCTVSIFKHPVSTDIGGACRSVLRGTLAKTIRWVVEKMRKHAWSSERVRATPALG